MKKRVPHGTPKSASVADLDKFTYKAQWRAGKPKHQE